MFKKINSAQEFLPSFFASIYSKVASFSVPFFLSPNFLLPISPVVVHLWLSSQREGEKALKFSELMERV